MVSTTSASKKPFNIQVQRAYAGLDDILHICPIYKFIVFHLRNRKLGIFGQTGKKVFQGFAKIIKIQQNKPQHCSWIFNTTYALSHRICFSPSKNGVLTSFFFSSFPSLLSLFVQCAHCRNLVVLAFPTPPTP